MGQQIRWDNVAPVNLGDASRAYAEAGQGIQQGLASLANAAANYKGMQQEKANRQLAYNMSQLGNSAALTKAYGNGSLYNGVNKDWLDSSHIAGVQSQILGLAKSERDTVLAAQRAATQASIGHKNAIEADQLEKKANVSPDDIARINAGLGALAPEGKAYQATLGRFNPSSALSMAKYAQEQQANAHANKIRDAGLNPEEVNAYLKANVSDDNVANTIRDNLGMPKLGVATNATEEAPVIAGNTGVNYIAKQQGAADPQSGETFGHWANNGAVDAIKRSKGYVPNNANGSSGAGVGQFTISNLKGDGKNGLWYQAGKTDNDAYSPQNQLDVLRYTVDKNKGNAKALQQYWNFLSPEQAKGSTEDIMDAITRHENGTSLSSLTSSLAKAATPTSRDERDLSDAIMSGSPSDAATKANTQADNLVKAFTTRVQPTVNDPRYIIASGGKNEDEKLSKAELATKYKIPNYTLDRIMAQLDHKVSPATAAALYNQNKEETGSLSHPLTAAAHPFNTGYEYVTGMNPQLANAVDLIKKGGGVDGAVGTFGKQVAQSKEVDSVRQRLSTATAALQELAQKTNKSPQEEAQTSQYRSTIKGLLTALKQAAS